MAGAGKDLVQRLPEPQRTVTDCMLGRNPKPSGPEVNRQLAPAMSAFAEADPEAEQFLAALGCRADDDQHAFRSRLHPGRPLDTVSPDVDAAAGEEIAAQPAVVIFLPARPEAQNPARRQGWLT